MVLSIYVLEMGKTLNPVKSVSGSHPPLRHRACWLIGAEGRALDALDKQTGSAYRKNIGLEEIRELMREALRGTARVQESLWSDIAGIDDAAEAQMNSCAARLRDSASPYFELLDRAQKVH